MSATARCLEAMEGPGSGSSRFLLFPGKEHRTSVTAAEFKKWLKQFDADGDGRISRRELREAIGHRGAWFASVKAWCAVRRADMDRNGFVDDCEMESLVEFAENELGFLISKEPTPDGRNHCRW
ncbi:probable calcium-binding protein CML22 [Miscanthus floridulus]|uniref:probable calcium-binding protein CML22 n=1 Tax=Miscanthus floridulus TaxID=154761 RepID=UPI003458BFD2